MSPNSVTLLYSFATRSYRRAARGPRHAGLDERQPPAAGRTLRPHRHARQRDRAATPVLGVAAHGISLSRDDRWLSYIENQAESDVWLATLAR